MMVTVSQVRGERKISTRLIRKGALIEETYLALQQWDLSLSFQDNIARLREENPLGARNAQWLREILTTFSSRFANPSALKPLVILSQGGVGLDIWKPCLLWHIGTRDELYYRFATEWLYPEFIKGTYQIRTEDLVPFVQSMTQGRVSLGGQLSEYGLVRAARDLLRMAADFGLLSGKTTRQFASYHLPKKGFLYILHALAETEMNATRLIHSPDWRLYLLSPGDVEGELLRLHQYRQLDYEVAGSLSQLRLPYASAAEYASGRIGSSSNAARTEALPSPTIWRPCFGNRMGTANGSPGIFQMRRLSS